MQHNYRWAWLAAMVLCLGCHSRPATVGLQGEVSYEGQAVKWGKIDFVPVEGTSGPSAGVPIADGRYAIPAKWGLLTDGVYLARITAFRKTGRMETHRADPGGQAGEVAENFIPAIYNDQSTLTVRVAELPDKYKADFHLGKAPASRSLHEPK